MDLAQLAEQGQWKLVETEKRGKVFLIAINRPANRNAVDHETGEQLCNAFGDFESDDEASVAVFYGKHGNFCAGYDLKELASMDPSTLKHSSVNYAPMGPSKTVFSKPVIAAISGYAVAGGLELALMCDMRVAEEDAIMGVFCRRFGVPLIDGGTVRLPYLVGLSRALDLILTGRPVLADEALSMGLVNRVVPVGDGVKSAVELANQIASFPRECMLADRKSSMYAAYDAKSWQDAMRFEHENGNVEAFSFDEQVVHILYYNEAIMMTMMMQRMKTVAVKMLFQGNQLMVLERLQKVLGEKDPSQIGNQSFDIQVYYQTFFTYANGGSIFTSLYLINQSINLIM
ncbi:LOW QUALITY PROTEIN: short-chain-enoyl-CoA hydratase-like [Anneissia japonica]|uniref:LOW QUALITY PROTEIN: short-chain-enoyl-CoA hydratase-like n=1 Tax=Anneissia japonica TaxID=1529436 RepID=UPI001425B2B1|nr:LOW QUALITY PROTEIN: short-chain-enoyl-CoA hydratase-like [Anneissia japonica]